MLVIIMCDVGMISGSGKGISIRQLLTRGDTAVDIQLRSEQALQDSDLKKGYDMNSKLLDLKDKHAEGTVLHKSYSDAFSEVYDRIRNLEHVLATPQTNTGIVTTARKNLKQAMAKYAQLTKK